MNSLVIFWISLTIILLVIEAMTPTLICIWPAIGALLAWVLALADAPLWLQIVVFIVASVILIILTRPLAKKFVSKKIIATNADRIIGAEGVVIQAIDPIENAGQIKAMGQIWSAKSADNEIIQSGTHVTITSLEGVKAVVKQNK